MKYIDKLGSLDQNMVQREFVKRKQYHGYFGKSG